MYEIVNTVLGLLALLGASWFVWESSVMISEKKERQRKGITDYYDNPIKKEKE